MWVKKKKVQYFHAKIFLFYCIVFASIIFWNPSVFSAAPYTYFYSIMHESTTALKLCRFENLIFSSSKVDMFINIYLSLGYRHMYQQCVLLTRMNYCIFRTRYYTRNPRTCCTFLIYRRAVILRHSNSQPYSPMTFGKRSKLSRNIITVKN